MTQKLREATREASKSLAMPTDVFDTLKADKEALQQERDRELEVGPQVTFLGSSNHTTRSNTLDLEAGAVLMTEDPALRKALKEEEARLVANTEEVTIQELRSEARRADWKTRVAMWIVGKVGGAL